MNKLYSLVLITVGAAGVFGADQIRASATGSSMVARERSLVERGRYIVHGVGLCIDCHSPRNERGEFIENRHLTGAPLAFKPTMEMPWMPAAPRIAGLPAGYTAEEVVQFLMTGQRPHGLPPTLPPMPPYRMNREDAEATVAYLRTLPAGEEQAPVAPGSSVVGLEPTRPAR
ncbi:MAG TPA: c-type cytochrome [Opitutus sp.]|nr:c-type cytochrome [Opitutus sp.]